MAKQRRSSGKKRRAIQQENLCTASGKILSMSATGAGSGTSHLFQCNLHGGPFFIIGHENLHDEKGFLSMVSVVTAAYQRDAELYVLYEVTNKGTPSEVNWAHVVGIGPESSLAKRKELDLVYVNK